MIERQCKGIRTEEAIMPSKPGPDEAGAAAGGTAAGGEAAAGFAGAGAGALRGAGGGGEEAGLEPKGLPREEEGFDEERDPPRGISETGMTHSLRRPRAAPILSSLYVCGHFSPLSLCMLVVFPSKAQLRPSAPPFPFTNSIHDRTCSVGAELQGRFKHFLVC